MMLRSQSRLQSAPSSPVLSQPDQAELGVPLDGVLAWEPSPRACDYRVEVDDDPSFANPEVDAITDQTQLTLSGLVGNSAYCWRVTARGFGGESASGIALFGTTTFVCDGDGNADFRVDFDDLNLVLAEWGNDGSNGGDVAPAPSGDGMVNFDDLNLVLDNHGVICH